MKSNLILLSITDDQNLFREGLKNLINQQDGMKVIYDTAGGEELLMQLCTNHPRPHIALIDMDMPGMNGLELNKRLQQDYPEIKVIILSVYNQATIIAQMIQQGADAYLEKNCGSQELIDTITKVHQTGFYISRAVMEAIQKNSEARNKSIQQLNQLNVHLTEREHQILTMVCRDLGTQEISEKLFISPRTVEGHRQNLLIKTGCKNTAGLVLFAIKYNIFSIDELKFES